MVDQSHDRIRAYGWRDFDPEVVEGLVENDSRFVDRRQDGWIACPLVGHYDDKLPWRDGNYRKGSVLCGDAPASFRAAPTYILESPLDNFIVGRNLIGEAIAGSWGRSADTGRLGSEWSEDALAWNVLRSLQETRSLDVVARMLAGTEPQSVAAAEPDLFFWGRHLEQTRTTAWVGLERVLDELEPGPDRQSAPDVCVHLPDWGWLLIEAGFGGGIDVYDDPARVATWLERYVDACPSVFDDEAIRGVKVREFPQRILRNIALAHRLKDADEHAVVVSLVREIDPTTIEKWVNRCLTASADVGFRRGTWEEIFRALDPGDSTHEPLRVYFENKSYGLRPAFALQESEPADG